MPRPTTEQIEDRLAVGLALDHLWSETMGLPIDDKGTVLAALVEVLRATDTPYAVIRGVARVVRELERAGAGRHAIETSSARSVFAVSSRGRAR